MNISLKYLIAASSLIAAFNTANAITMSYTETINGSLTYGLYDTPDPSGDLQYADYMQYGLQDDPRQAPTLKFDASLGTLKSVEIKFSSTLSTSIYADAGAGNEIIAGYLKTTAQWEFSANTPGYNDRGSEQLPYQYSIDISEQKAGWKDPYAYNPNSVLLPEGTTGSYVFNDVQTILIETGVLTQEDLLRELTLGDGVTFNPILKLQAFFADADSNNVITKMDLTGTNAEGTDGEFFDSENDIYYGPENPWNFEIIYTYEAVPEPSSFALIGLAGVALILRRNRNGGVA